MTAISAKKSRHIISEDLKVLRGYAKRAVVSGKSLETSEDEDRSARIRQYMELGQGFKLTDREMVILLFRDLLKPRRTCGCPTCRQRAEQQGMT